MDEGGKEVEVEGEVEGAMGVVVSRSLGKVDKGRRQDRRLTP